MTVTKNGWAFYLVGVLCAMRLS